MRNSVATLALACSFIIFSAPAFAAKTTLDAADQKFMTQAAQSGTMEVSLGDLAREKAKDPQVKNFGQRMVTDHTKVNRELEALAKKKNVTLPKRMERMQEDEVRRMSEMQGTSFDREYMNTMVTEHEKDVADFQKTAKSAKDPDVKKFASKTLPTLKEHLKLARTLKTKVNK